MAGWQRHARRRCRRGPGLRRRRQRHADRVDRVRHLLRWSGDDTITGGGTDGVYDTLDGGDGNDLITGGANDDYISGGAGNDVINTGATNGNYLGDDHAAGGDGDDTITGGAGVQYLSATPATTTLNGGADDDFLYSGTGVDALDGGIGH